MRVLHVIPSVSERSGGPGVAILPMCRALIKCGVEVLLAATDDGLSRVGTGVVDHEGVPAIFFSSQLGESFKYSRSLSVWLDAHVDQFDVGHIHAVFNHSSVAAARAFHKARVPYVIRPLGTLDPWSMKQKALRKRLFWSVAGEKMLNRAAAVHYTSQAEKTATEGLLGVNHGQVIPLGIEAAPHRRPEDSFGSYALVLSRLHPKKGIDVLIEAFIAMKFDRWRLIIAGEGPPDYVARLKRKAAAAGDKISFRGWVDGDEKEELLGHASLLVLPSYQENFGLCVMEALARSVPVLISPHVNLANEIESAKAGWIALVEVPALSATLAEALGNPGELAERGRAGKRLSLNYSWERAATDLSKLYTEITNGGAGIH